MAEKKSKSNRRRPTIPKPAAAPPAPTLDTLVHVICYGNARGRIWQADPADKGAFTLTVDHCVRDGEGNETISEAFHVADVRHLAKVVKECCRWIEWQQGRLFPSTPPPRSTRKEPRHG